MTWNAEEFGEMVFDSIRRTTVLETTGWAAERAARVEARINGVRTAPPLEVVVPWIQEHLAFTLWGRYVYLCRRLMELCRDDEMAAFVVAHEMAHHDLGHLDSELPDWIGRLAGDELTPLMLGRLRGFVRRLHGPEQECDADRLALDLCMAAGYDPLRCLAIFDILEKLSLDLGDVEGVFGPSEADDDLAPDAPWSIRAKIWWFQRRRGYLPLRDRRQMLLDHLGAHSLTA